VRFILDDEGVALEVEDNGRGFELTESWLEMARQGHLGLAGVRERTEALKGTINIHSDPGKGTWIQVDVPLAG
jgi:signal transduction histidine kinase